LVFKKKMRLHSESY